MRFLDANIFLRYLTGDHVVMSRACQELFAEIEQGLQETTTCEAVITEIVYVLRSRNVYGLSAEEVRDRLRPVLSLPGLRIPNREVYFHALDLIVSEPSLDIEDAVCAAHMERLGLTEIYTFDRHFDRLSGIHRVEPGATDDR